MKFEAPSTVPSRVLVVDDDPTVSDVVRRYLERAGFVVDTASDGPTRPRARRRTSADLVVLDLMLPGMSGLEVCRRLRRTSDVPIVMLTALGEEADRVVGFETGADDYVTKPFSPRELVLRVQSVLRRASRGRHRCPTTVRWWTAAWLSTWSPEPRSATPDRWPSPCASSTCWLFLRHPAGRSPRRAAGAGLGLDLRRPVDRDRPRATAAREGRGRPGGTAPDRHRVGRRVPVRTRGAVMPELVVVLLLALAGSGLVGDRRPARPACGCADGRSPCISWSCSP